MRILHIYKTYYPDGFGGVQQVIRQLGNRHTAAGHQVSVLALSPHTRVPAQFLHENITVHQFPMDFELASNGISLAAMRAFPALAAQHDLLHYHFPWPSGDVLHQLAPKNIPAMATYHSDIVRQKLLKLAYAPLMHHFLRQMQALVATSPEYLASSPTLAHYRAKTSVIPIGLEETLYPVPDAALLEQWRTQLGTGFFLFVGALRYYKGLHTLINAAKQSSLPIVIAGTGGIEAELRAQAADAPNIHFLGEVSDADKMALLRLCRAFVFPSHLRSEAFGISLLEAAMAGKPMISCAIESGMRYINRNGITGIEVPPQNAELLAGAMEALNENPDMCQHYGAAARTRFHSLFTAQKMADDYLALYGRLLA